MNKVSCSHLVKSQFTVVNKVNQRALHPPRPRIHQPVGQRLRRAETSDDKRRPRAPAIIYSAANSRRRCGPQIWQRHATRKVEKIMRARRAADLTCVTDEKSRSRPHEPTGHVSQ